MWNLLISKFKDLFYKTENSVVAEIFVVVHHNKMYTRMTAKICILPLAFIVTVKMLFLFVIMVKNLYCSIQKQNNKLIKSPSLNKPITLSWDKKLQRVFSSLVNGIEHKNRGKSFWKCSELNFFTSFYYITYIFFHASLDCWVVLIPPHFLKFCSETP